jgi:hypothetical protein
MYEEEERQENNNNNTNNNNVYLQLINRQVFIEESTTG